jgi:hypothetical protein
MNLKLTLLVLIIATIIFSCKKDKDNSTSVIPDKLDGIWSYELTVTDLGDIYTLEDEINAVFFIRFYDGNKYSFYDAHGKDSGNFQVKGNTISGINYNNRYWEVIIKENKIYLKDTINHYAYILKKVIDQHPSNSMFIGTWNITNAIFKLHYGHIIAANDSFIYDPGEYTYTFNEDESIDIIQQGNPSTSFYLNKGNNQIALVNPFQQGFLAKFHYDFIREDRLILTIEKTDADSYYYRRLELTKM